jgi:hypothetical protein
MKPSLRVECEGSESMLLESKQRTAELIPDQLTFSAPFSLHALDCSSTNTLCTDVVVGSRLAME